MKLRFLGGRYQGRIIDLKPTGFAIGRGRDNDLVLDEEGVSRNHCTVTEVGGKWMIEDCQSTNGVRVNGERIEGKRELKPGDRIGIHHALFLFTDGSDIVSPTAAGVPDAAGAVPPPQPEAVTEMDAKPEPDEETPELEIPWFRLALLLAMMGLLAWLVVVTFTQDSKKKADKKEAAVPADIQAGKKDQFSDDELAKLMAEEEGDDSPNSSPAASRPSAGKSDPFAGGKTPRPGPGKAQVPVSPASRPTTPIMTGIALVSSEPAGATVLVDGKPQGTTPVVLNALPKGRHKVTLQLAGYEDYTRQIHMPDVLPTEPYVLRQKPGTVKVESDPPGATVWHGSQILGKTPMMLTDYGEGQHDLRITSAGYEAVKKTVEVSKIRGETVKVKLPSLMGGIEIVTSPPDCRVMVDGLYKGVTAVGGDAKTRQSKPFALGGLPEGEHLVVVEHSHGMPQRAKVKVERGKTDHFDVKLWIVDTKVVLNEGGTRYGMLMEKDRHGDILLAEAPKTYKRYYSVQIKEVVSISAADAQDYLKGRRGGGHSAASEPKRVREPAQEPAPEGAAPDRAAEEPAPPAPEDDGAPLRVSSDEVLNAFKRATATELNRRFQNRKIELTGKTTAFGKDGLGGYVSFGPKIRCFISQEDYEKMRDALQEAAANEVPVTISGVAAGIRANKLVVRDGKLVSGK